MNLEEQIANELGKEMQKAMDFEFIAELLCQQGWTRYSISRFTDNYHAIDIGNWLVDNCQSKYQRNGRTFVFESSKDATMFILRWGS